MISRNLEISLNSAVQVAQENGHEYVGVEHILYALLDNPEARKALLASGASLDKTKKDIEAYFIDKLQINLLPAGANPQPTLAFQRVLQEAAQQVLSAGKDKIFGDSLLVAIFSEKESYATYFLECQEVSRFDLIDYISHGTIKDGVAPEVLEKELSKQGKSSLQMNFPMTHQKHIPEESEDTKSDANQEETKNNEEKSDPLSLYTVNLLDKATAGGIDPLVGREYELDRALQILCRRRKNNPLLVGEAGVGKTAIVEGLALKIFEEKVPKFLSGTQIYSLDLGSLLAGTKFRGDFEKRLKGLIKQIKKQANAILFIDEIHTIMGAGAVSGGSLDASNILKPFLSSGEVRCIGSTTFKEYRQHIENDHALTRRFQKISVEEPSVEESIKILKGIKSQYEDFHQVRYSSDAIKAAVELSHIHLKDKKLPDKAIDVIDEAGAFLVANAKKKTSAKYSHVGLNQVKAIIAKIARIPAERLSSSDRNQLKNLKHSLEKLIFGQNEAIEALDQAICMSRSGLAKDEKPIGSFLFSGPTGVGKTELAKQLAKLLGVSFLRFDMSEYMERHAVSRLVGAPPGYVGYEEGGLLTDAVHQNPYAVLLLDEIEKSHSDVHNILLQIMDHGTLTDSNGRKTNFQNIVLIMTTNVGASELTKSSIGFSQSEIEEGKDKGAIRAAFTPEFRNRLDGIISFNPLPKKVMLKIVEKFLSEIEVKLQAKKLSWKVSAAAKKFLADKGYSPNYGARPLARLIEDQIKKPLSQKLIFDELAKGTCIKIDKENNNEKLSFTFEE